jgi:hypothetical protein
MMREWSAVVISGAMGSMNLKWMTRDWNERNGVRLKDFYVLKEITGLGSKIFRWSHMLTSNPYHLVYPVV